MSSQAFQKFQLVKEKFSVPNHLTHEAGEKYKGKCSRLQGVQILEESKEPRNSFLSEA